MMRRRLQVGVQPDAVACIGEDRAVGRRDVLDVEYRHARAIRKRDQALRVAQRAQAVRDRKPAADEPEQRQRIDRIAEQQQPRERADHRYRHRDERNDRCAPGLQKQDHHKHHQHDRLDQRVLDRANRFAHEHRRAPHRLVGEPRRKPLRQFVKLRVHRLRDRERLRARRQDHADHHRLPVVEERAQRVVAIASIRARCCA